MNGTSHLFIENCNHNETKQDKHRSVSFMAYIISRGTLYTLQQLTWPVRNIASMKTKSCHDVNLSLLQPAVPPVTTKLTS